ncbi:MAG: chemotaxis protein CheW [Burkholderiaceae bacterium]|jgi:twitching motility protein PilI|nr:chemotaxis protein CheW [Burkholderiaceae bacterium]
MATKQTLREFQSYLAQRLVAAQTSGKTASWLAVQAGQARLLLPLSHAGEIFSWSGVQRVPYARDWFLGVANLRGGLFGVIDLGALLGGQPAGRHTESDLAQSRLLALNPVLETNSALLVDRLLGLRTMDSFAASNAPGADAPPYHGHVYTDADGSRWQEVNLQALSQHPVFLDIGAQSA